MSTARITREQYDHLIRVYRERPGVYSHAAREVGLQHRTAKRAWERGWDRPDWARPIHERLREEQEAARAILARAEVDRAQDDARRREDQRLATLDAAQERAREAQALRASLSATLSLFAHIGTVSPAIQALSAKAAKDIMASLQAGTVTPKQTLDTLKAISLVGSRASEMLKSTMEAIRLHIGEPGSYIGVKHSVDDGAAVQALGSEAALAKAIQDLVTGQMTPEALALLDFQAGGSGSLN